MVTTNRKDMQAPLAGTSGLGTESEVQVQLLVEVVVFACARRPEIFGAIFGRSTVGMCAKARQFLSWAEVNSYATASMDGPQRSLSFKFLRTDIDYSTTEEQWSSALYARSFKIWPDLFSLRMYNNKEDRDGSLEYTWLHLGVRNVIVYQILRCYQTFFFFFFCNSAARYVSDNWFHKRDRWLPILQSRSYFQLCGSQSVIVPRSRSAGHQAVRYIHPTPSRTITTFVHGVPTQRRRCRYGNVVAFVVA